MSDQESTASTSRRVECGAAAEPIIRLLIMTLMCLGFGLWSIYELSTGKFAEPGKEATLWFTRACAVLLTPAGLALLAVMFTKARRRLVADAEGIGYVGKATVAWGQVTRLVLRSKGLLDVHYDAEGDDQILELDSYRLKSFDQLVQVIEANTEGKPVEKAK